MEHAKSSFTTESSHQALVIGPDHPSFNCSEPKECFTHYLYQKHGLDGEQKGIRGKRTRLGSA